MVLTAQSNSASWAVGDGVARARLRALVRRHPPSGCAAQARDRRRPAAILTYPRFPRGRSSSEPRRRPLPRIRQGNKERPMSQKRVNVAIIGLGFGAEFIPIYQKHPQRQHVRHLPAHREQAQRNRRRIRRREAIHQLRRRARRSRSRLRAHQHADSRPRAAVDRRAEGRQARHLHRADGHDDRGVRGRSSISSSRPA